MGAFRAVEDTLEHRELFGEDGDCVEYYASLENLVAKGKSLCTQPERARALADKVFQRVCQHNRHTDAGRLQTILNDLA